MNFKDIIDLFGKDNIQSWVLELPSFYFRPLDTYSSFFKKNETVKLQQTILYITLTSILFYIFTETTLKEITGNVIKEILWLFLLFFVLFLTNNILRLLFKVNFKSSNIIYFLVLVKFLSLPLILCFELLFLKSEMYEYAFIRNSILATIIIFIYFYSNNIFYQKLKYILIGSLSNLLIANLLIIIICISKFDKFEYYEETLDSDPIYNEYESKILNHLDSNLDKLPLLKLQVDFIGRRDNSTFLIFNLKDTVNIFDSLKSVMKSNISYKKAIIAELKYFTEITGKIKFKRNQTIVIARLNYINDVINQDKYSEITDLQMLLKNDSFFHKEKKIFQFQVLPINLNIYASYLAYNEILFNYTNSGEISSYPTY